MYLHARACTSHIERNSESQKERKKERSVSLEEKEEEEEEAGKKKKKLESFSLLSFSLSLFFFFRGDTSRPQIIQTGVVRSLYQGFGKLALYILRLA